MDTIIIRYEDNGLVCYDRKEYVESLSKVDRQKSVTLERYRSVVRTKSRIWKAVVVDPEPSQLPTQLPRAQKRQAVWIKIATS